ncbi:MAG: hydroxymethylbilane synthase [Burkholderiaceae bacterium]
MNNIVIATRESRLALWQARHVQALLDGMGVNASLLGMTTRGDQIVDRTLSKVGGKGLFVKELETALESGDAHLAVHSLKDMPMDLPAGFELVAVLDREDPRDAFVSNKYASLAELPQGALVGTSSLRRVAQLLALRPDLRMAPLRGNLDTRLRKLDEGGYDAIVLAAAGLVRLGLAERIRARFDVDQMIPAAGQGALGLEIRADNASLHDRLVPMIAPDTWLAVHAERAVARALGGSCSMPLAAFAVRDADGRFTLRAALGDAAVGAALETGIGHEDPRVDARPLLKAGETATLADAAAAEALGRRVAAALLAAGGDAYLLPAGA